MTVHDQTIDKILQMPEFLVQEVSDFIDFLLWRHSSNLTESLEIVKSDFSDYLPNLEDYENRLAHGKIEW